LQYLIVVLSALLIFTNFQDVQRMATWFIWMFR